MSDATTFTIPPPTHLQKHFTEHPMRAVDQIEAHMHIFDAATDSEAYLKLVAATLGKIQTWLK